MDKLNCTQFKDMIVSGVNNLQNKHELINTLNVFPVPDGDTGTNMTMTFMSGVEAATALMNDHVGDTAKALARSMLMGARGNSGVILSQIFKGIQKGFVGKETITTQDFCDAYASGVATAYKAVMKPVEGTILTVVRESSEKGVALLAENPAATVIEYVDCILQAAQQSLNNTPELLPVLKEVGVVDSGGAGLVAIIEGFAAYLHGNPIMLQAQQEGEIPTNVPQGYCVEVIFDLNNQYRKAFDAEKLNKSLAKSCTEVKLTRNDHQGKLHVHTMNPGEILTTLMKFGDLTMVKVENMAHGFKHVIDFVESKPKEKYSIITVCNGDGIEEAFKQLGVEYFVKGGQTMNPATEDFVTLINNYINAEHIIILPNNSNIIMAANQAKDVLKEQSIEVIPSKSIPQGISACLNFNPEAELLENIASMTEAIGSIETGEVTHSIKDTSYNYVQIKEGEFIGIWNKDIVATSSDLVETTKATLDKMVSDASAYVTIIYGTETNEETAGEIQSYVTDKFGVDCDLIDGKQDLYPFIIGVE